MTLPFKHTLRSLGRDRLSAWGLAPALVLGSAWVVWLFRAELVLYATTPRARIEAMVSPSHVAVAATGRVKRFRLALGQPIEAGDELLELDGLIKSSELEALLAQAQVLDRKGSIVQAQIAAKTVESGGHSRSTVLALQKAQVSLHQAEAAARQQERLTGIAEKLRSEQVNSEVDLLVARGELEQRLLGVAEAAAEHSRLAADRQYQAQAELTRLVELERQAIEVESERVAVQSAIATARAELERLRVVAPVSGVVGQVAALQQGDVVQAGQIVATIVPAARVRVVAYFAPEDAVGSVLAGQRARVRFDALARSEELDALVENVASEPHDGWIRVELGLENITLERVAMQHGQTAAVDIRISSSSPWALLRRSVARAKGAAPADFHRSDDPAPGSLARRGEP